MAVAVVVNHKMKEGKLEEFIEYMQEMIKLTKQEDGCIAYDLYAEEGNTRECVMVEIWENKEKLDVHMESEHFKVFIPGGAIYQEAPCEIKVYNRL
jgi:Uncharacterized conserved protein